MSEIDNVGTEVPPIIPPVVVETPPVIVPPVVKEVEDEVKTPIVKVEADKVDVKPDPLVIEYCEMLKSNLGKDYDTELDKLPIKERINIMKHLNAYKTKMSVSKEAHVPNPSPSPSKKKSGYNFKALGKKY